MEAESVAKSCLDVVQLCKDAESWLSDNKNSDRIGRERTTLMRSVRRMAIKAKRLEATARRPMSVAVFGPSQVGKSYLVSVIASPADRTLQAKFDGQDSVDFLTQINPAGEKESTGLVTRFTTRPLASPPPSGFPVGLTLLSEPDIVKILGNSYFNDGDQSKETIPEIEEITAAIQALRARRRGPNGLTEDDILDLQDYYEKHFVGNQLIGTLSNYWKDILELAPVLDVEGRATLFSFLWGRHAKFTWLYTQLAAAIETLARADEAFGQMEALLPREKSIIDVATLEHVGKSDGTTVRLKTRDGREAALPRALATALVGELRIEMAERPRGMFEHIDLLDFPGARSRQKFALSVHLNEKELGLRDCFLRGKVAYLFDRYVANQELTAMMLCVRPSNMEVVTLPDMVDEWISDTHGRTPEARVGKATTLFFVLTWFDTHFVDKAGDLMSPSGRFKARMDASLLGSFGKAHNWPRQWTPDRPFNNCFWFRNPNYPASSIIRYEGTREIGVIPEMALRIDELKNGFLSVPEVIEHFREPPRAFDEGLRLNDGGASYIVANLEPVCRPELKAEQIRSRLDAIRHDLTALLARFYISLDVESRLEERRKAAMAVFDALENGIASKTFATLLRYLMVDPTDLSEEIYAALRSGLSNAPKAALGATETEQRRPGMPIRPGQKPVAPVANGSGHGGGENGAGVNTMLAQFVVDAFIARMRRTADNDLVARATKVSREATVVIVDEIISLASRTNLQGVLAEMIKRHLGVPKPEPESAARIAFIATTQINRLIADFGFGRLPAKEKPEVALDGVRRLAFDTRPIVYDARNLREEPKPFAMDYYTDWFNGFYKVVEDNALTMSGIQVDVVQNTRLKAILDGLHGSGM